MTDAQLAAQLEQLGIYFVANDTPQIDIQVAPDSLLSGLASSPQARLRLALIPLFLKCPHLATAVRPAMKQIDAAAQLTLRCYFTAAQLLQEIHQDTLHELFGTQVPLPALFNSLLGLDETKTAAERLQ
ncbi:MAG: hypothetical protein KDE51_25605, partial [Anaerolineales bacterium]|nr:hypothetical protein [Anaerolineales bacterium]